MATTKPKAADTAKAPVAKKTDAAQAPVQAPKKVKQSKPIIIAKAAAASQEDKVMQHLKLHGKEFVGMVISDKAHKTVTVEWERRRLIQKFERYEKRYSRVYAHNPIAINAKMGDTVRIKETRPLSKTKNFVVVEIVKNASALEAENAKIAKAAKELASKNAAKAVANKATTKEVAQ